MKLPQHSLALYYWVPSRDVIDTDISFGTTQKVIKLRPSGLGADATGRILTNWFHPFSIQNRLEWIIRVIVMAKHQFSMPLVLFALNLVS